MENFLMIIKLLASLAFVIFLLILTMRYGGSKLNTLQAGRYIRVIDKTSLSKEASLDVVKIGEEAFVISVTKDRIEILKEVTKDDLEKIEMRQKAPQYSYKDIKDLINKLSIKGRKKYEKE